MKYKQSTVKATSVGVTPEVERVKQNQENISSARKHQDIFIIFYYMQSGSSAVLKTVLYNLIVNHQGLGR